MCVRGDGWRNAKARGCDWLSIAGGRSGGENNQQKNENPIQR